MRGDIEYGEIGLEGPSGIEGAPAFNGEKGHKGNFIVRYAIMRFAILQSIWVCIEHLQSTV